MGKQLKEVLAILAIGDGVLGLAAPRRHSLLWEVWAGGLQVGSWRRSRGVRFWYGLSLQLL